jgi:peroxiredoxin
MAVRDPRVLPPDLPVPANDGAAAHLPGTSLPSLALPATAGQAVDLSARPGLAVVFAYPRTGRPGEDLPGGEDSWNAIPGARGCTPELCGIRDDHAALRGLGAEVFGLSTQDTAYQREAVRRLGLTYPLLSDESLALTRALRLPTFETGGLTLLRRLTLIVRDGVVADVIYPVFPPDEAAARAAERIRALAGRGSG